MPQRLSDVPLADLVPETRLWNDGRGIDLESWIGCDGDIEHAIGYGELFWPDFVEHNDCVLYAPFNKDSYLGFMQQTSGNRRAVESVMNHRHILDLFAISDNEPSREQVVYLGRLLKEMWTAKLKHEFPEKHFVVSFPEDENTELWDYEITFYQNRAT
jgi:hypothetical protein